MRMTQNNGIDAFGIKGKGFRIACFIFATTLDQTTIEQNPVLADSQQVTGTGHLAGSAEKLDIQSHIMPLGQQAQEMFG